MLNSRSVGNKIAVARKRNSLSQAELAQQVAISYQAVGKWERGESMPDITTLNRVAEILGVDLNYFSDSFQSADVVETPTELRQDVSTDSYEHVQKRKLNWDLSKLNLVDSDFSGLKDLHEKLSSTNIQKCLFIGSELSGLHLNNNIVADSDFTSSDISRSHVHSSILGKCSFSNCTLAETEFSKSVIGDCNFSDADLTKTTFRSSSFGKNIMSHAILTETSFNETHIQDVVFEGALNECRFENCTFHNVKFQNATLTNTFFKNNKKMNRVQFVDCVADTLTYAFLKNNGADMEGVGVKL